MDRYCRWSRWLRERYGCRVHKICVDAAFTCPNRDGEKGVGGCIFCTPYGGGTGGNSSGALISGKGVTETNALVSVKDAISRQIMLGAEVAARRFRAEAFILYFQSFTSTYAPVSVLEEIYSHGLNELKNMGARVVGLSVGARPDCIDESICDLLLSLKSDLTDVWMEIGAQTFDDDALRWLERGHDRRQIFTAGEMCSKFGLMTCYHIILGIPSETDEILRDNARCLGGLKANAVKFHPLHVLRESRLEQKYNTGSFVPIEKYEYIRRLALFLSLTAPDVAIQRLTADASAQMLVAPEWISDKAKFIKDFEIYIEDNAIEQGRRFINR